MGKSKAEVERRMQDYRDILTYHRVETKTKLKDLQARMKDRRDANRQGGVDAAEEAQNNVQEDIDIQLVTQYETTLRSIEKAFDRIENRTYGVCRGCGEEIATNRLRALPFAIKCKLCAEHKSTSGRKTHHDAQPDEEDDAAVYLRATRGSEYTRRLMNAGL